jgi:hypothetical protein
METKKDIIETEDNSLLYFANEEAELNNAIKEIDDLYDEIKIHYDRVKNASMHANGGRGVLTFLQNQTGNLVALKNSKASLINNKITMKKYAADLALKQKKDMNESQVNNDIINAILDKLNAEEETATIIDVDDITDNNKILEVSPDELLEKRIKDLQKSGDIEPDEDDSNDNCLLAIYLHNKRWKFIGVNELGHIVKGFKVPDKKNFSMKFHKKKSGEIYATDQDNKIYKVIKK